MHALLDSSVLIAALDSGQAHHAACDRLLSAGGNGVCQHALAEVFSIFTGGRLGSRISAAVACQLLEQSVLPLVEVVTLSARDMMATLKSAQARGARGGAVYDLLHLAAARKTRAEVLVTLNLRDFQALTLRGDPRIEAP